MNLLLEMRRSQVRPNVVSYNAAMSASEKCQHNELPVVRIRLGRRGGLA